EAMEARDTDLIVALAAIAMRRAGKTYLMDHLWDTPIGSITLDATDEELEESPPQESSGGRSDSESDPSGVSTNGSTDISPETFPQSDSGMPQPDDTADRPTLTT